MALSGNAASPAEHSMHDLLWNMLSFVVVVGYFWRLFEVGSQDLRLLQNPQYGYGLGTSWPLTKEPSA